MSGPSVVSEAATCDDPDIATTTPQTPPTDADDAITVALRQCRQLGRKRAFPELLHHALTTLQADTSSTQSQHAASLHAFIGCAYFHMHRTLDAIPHLQRASTLQSRETKAAHDLLKICYEHHPSQIPIPPLLKYPRTTHLFDTGGTATTRDDLVLSDMAPVLASAGDVIIEEKIDGSNLGIRICPYSHKIYVQNRGHYITHGEHAQYSRLTQWLALHREALFRILGDGHCILYGEWMAARHSLAYKTLPGWFVAFDLYDTVARKFVSRRTFHTLLQGTQIPVPPIMWRGRLCNAHEQLLQLLQTASQFRTDGGTVEGIVIRIDDDAWLVDKYKVVRPDFVRGCSDGPHWSRREVESQTVDAEFARAHCRTCYPLADER
mmetsp:Transcript_729/g.2074  ORF Transcript_729/g.2074 Transcript_729/m.2074 type:complete len:379 (-) Transcript_729:126-1262(-)|eukprot:CAMPEP_0198116574 /NCGR_PEP_ID=MMETSP1442-20131203/13256_1 /TAXON_ID= /ORGANISM="Craspedostauros australis, Strain CCMP3328" /LENGTH=378 /DNA_ID=CAMNT_0043774429 /DNA_START=110 /DNA_END=1246 /DNA_ORIENTATION=+